MFTVKGTSAPRFWKVNSLRPTLSSGNGEEGEKGPSHVVVVEVALLPLSLLRLDFVVAFVD